MFSIGRKETNRLTRRNLEKHQREIELHGSEQGNRTQASDDLEEHRLDRRSAGKQARCEDGECSEYNAESERRKLDANFEAIIMSIDSDEDEPSAGFKLPSNSNVFEGSRHATSSQSAKDAHETDDNGQELNSSEGGQMNTRGSTENPHLKPSLCIFMRKEHVLPSALASPSRVSLSSTATASDLPCPGRALDSLYQRAGRFLEKTIDKASKPSVSNTLVASKALSSPSQVSISSTATQSDLPGPGRALDALYSRAGRILEEFINITAHRCGFGPHATSKRLADYVGARQNTREMYGRGIFGMLVKQVTVVEKGWMKMLRYTEHGTFKTRITAMSLMVQLYFMVAALWNTRPNVLSATLIALQRGAMNIERNTKYAEEAEIVKVLALQLTVLFLPCTSSRICVEADLSTLEEGRGKKGDGMVLYDTKALQQMLSDPAMTFVIPAFVQTPIFYFHLEMGTNLLAPPRPAKHHGARLNTMVSLVQHMRSEYRQNWNEGGGGVLDDGPLIIGTSYDSEDDTSDEDTGDEDSDDVGESSSRLYGSTDYGTGWHNGWFLNALGGQGDDFDSD